MDSPHVRLGLATLNQGAHTLRIQILPGHVLLCGQAVCRIVALLAEWRLLLWQRVALDTINLSHIYILVSLLFRDYHGPVLSHLVNATEMHDYYESKGKCSTLFSWLFPQSST